MVRKKKVETTAEKKKSVTKTKPKKKAAAKTKASDGFPIVGMGASAGGLEALEAFFSHMPPGKNIAFVIIQHLSPKHKSIMGSLLSKCTQMEVLDLEDGMKVQPNRVYLNPPDKNVVIINRTFQLMDPVRTGGINLPIDCFFKSMLRAGGKGDLYYPFGHGNGWHPGAKEHQGGGRGGHGPGPGISQIRRHAEKRHSDWACGLYPARGKDSCRTCQVYPHPLYRGLQETPGE